MSDAAISRDPWDTTAAIELTVAGVRALANGLTVEAAWLLGEAVKVGHGERRTDEQWELTRACMRWVDGARRVS